MGPPGRSSATQRRRIVLAGLIAVGVIAGAWLLYFADLGETSIPAIVDPAATPTAPLPPQTQRTTSGEAPTSDSIQSVAGSGAPEHVQLEAPVPAGLVTAKLSVRVVDPSGAGAADAIVMVWPSVAAMASDEPLTARTDSNGECVIDAPTPMAIIAHKSAIGTSTCFAWPPVRAPFSMPSEDDDVDTKISSGGLTLRLDGATWLRGSVSDANGQPIAGAHVIAGDEPPSDLKEPVQLAPYTDLFFGGGQSLLPRVIPSDDAGRFELGMGPRSGGYVYAVTKEGRTPAVMFVMEDGEEQQVELRLVGGFSITGALVGPPKDFVQAKVWARSDEDLVRLDGHVNDHGDYRIEIAKPGDYGIFASAPGFIQDRLVFAQLTEQVRDVRADIQLVESVPLSGTIRLSTGEPLVQAMLGIEREVPDGMSAWACSGSDSANAFTGEDGAFEFDAVHPSEEATLVLYVNCQPNRFRHLRPDRSPFEFVASRTHRGSVTLRVADANTGAPIESYEYSVPGNCDWRRVIDRQGRCDVHLQSPEREILILVRAEGYAMGTSAPFHVTAESTEIGMQLGRVGGLEIRLQDVLGDPCAGATVTLLSEGMVSVWNESYPVVLTTDATGTAIASGLTPGRYWLACRLDERRLGPLAVTVPSGRSQPYTLIVPADKAAGSIVARMCADPMDGTVYEFVLEPSGLLNGFVDLEPLRRPAGISDSAFDSLPAGIYALTLTRDRDDGEWCRVIVEPGSRADVILCPD